MPRWLTHGRSFRRYAQRWRAQQESGRQAVFRDMSSVISPTARVDRDWQEDDKLLFGYTGQSWTTTPAPVTQFPAVAIFTGDRPVMIHAVSFTIRDHLGVFPAWHQACILTPDNSYNPVLNAPQLMFPGFNTNPDNDFFVLPHALVVQGYQTALYAATIGGFVVNPVVGPAQMNNWWEEKYQHFEIPHDPPMIVPPQRIWALQDFVPFVGPHNGEFMEWTLWFSERDAA